MDAIVLLEPLIDDDDDDDDDSNGGNGDNNGGAPNNNDDTAGCDANVGQYSDWTAIIARNIMVTSGVELILNADYGTSSVPVPPNDGLIGTRVHLTK